MAGKGKPKIEAFGYMRTSSATNVGRDKDSEQRQRVTNPHRSKPPFAGRPGAVEKPTGHLTVGIITVVGA
jgi:hypothetical protein